jgi:hypothetical protein
MNEAEFVALLIRNAVKPPLMLADAYPSDGAKLTYRIRKTQVQSSVCEFNQSLVELAAFNRVIAKKSPAYFQNLHNKIEVLSWLTF